MEALCTAVLNKTSSLKKQTGNVLIIDDDKDVLSAAKLLLKNNYSLVHATDDPAEIPSLLKSENYDLILLDMNFNRHTTSGEEGFAWLKRILAWDPTISIILVTAYGDVEMAVKGIKEGATDFVLKPWVNEKMLATVETALQLRKSKTQVENLQTLHQQIHLDKDITFGEIIGKSEAMKKVFDTIRKVAATDANVLLLGENGTGKEVVAHTIHQISRRTGENFVSIDLGAVSEHLFESELFGHTKGAFTDAKDNRAGRFETASGGTLFLDEIGNLQLPLQAKLLSALQSRKIVRVGSNKEIPVDIRLICATNLPVYQMVEEGKFRQDLLFRINTIEISLPPLRERIEDIPLLVNHFLEVYSKKYHKAKKQVCDAAIKSLTEYRWPGNVRELQHSVERAVIMSEGEILQATDFLFPSASSQTGNNNFGKNKSELGLDNYNLEGAEKMIILKVIDKHKGNISRAAKELGLTRAALYRRIEKYGL
jgi:DNA-binding NtrC family response regulator